MLPEQLMINRELSWLEFNKRVLSEALRTDVPLFERLKFAAIYFSNLDEFFMVRVGSLTDQSIVTPDLLDDKTGWNAAQQVQHMLETVHSYDPLTEEVYNALKAELKRNEIDIVRPSKANKMEEMIAQKYFDEEISPFLSPQIVDRHHPFPFLRNKEKYVVTAQTTKSGSERFGIIPIEHLPDYFTVHFDGRTKIFFTCDIVEHFVSRLFTKQKIHQCCTIRVTRNADIPVDDALLEYEMDFRGVMQELLKKRRRLCAVRLQMSAPGSEVLRKYLCGHMDIDERSVFVQKIPLDFGFGFSLGGKLKVGSSMVYPERKPVTPYIFRDKTSMYELAEKEILISYPFHSYRPFLDLLDEAADDPDVVSIKISLYRLAGHSQVVSALCRAAERGKEVLAMLELRARFDEQSNIDYSSILEEAGCTVIYGLSEYKVHAKLCLITRRGEDGQVSYTTQIGTGNYNEKTSEQYTDLCFITNDSAIGRDATQAFHCLQMGETVDATEALWIAPDCYRSNVIDLIDREILEQKNGGQGYVAIKVNSLNDIGLMEKLVEASQAGVEIFLCIRGICCLRPGVEGYTENITIRSVVGRYLEHSRIFIFGQGERQRIFMGSGDLLNRNTRRRVEIFAEPKSPQVREQLLHIMLSIQQDNRQAWTMQPDGTYQRVECPEGAQPHNSQMELYDYFTRVTNVKPEPKPQPGPEPRPEQTAAAASDGEPVIELVPANASRPEPPRKRGFLARLFGW